MKRVSSSRRKDNISSPARRSRSTERSDNREEEIATANPENPDKEEESDIRRSMSDPFDSQFLDALSSMDDADEQEPASSNVPATTDASTIPTLPRYPIASTRDTNCWSESPISTFSIRGPQYFVDHKKVPSSPYLLTACGGDLLLCEPSSPPLDPNKLLDGQFTKRPTLGIVFSFPWGYMNMYFELPSYCANTETTTDISSLNPQERTFYQWYMADDDEEYRNQRLKLIAYVASGPWIVRNIVTGRPALMGRKLPVVYHPKCPNGSLLITLEIGQGSATAQRIVSVCRRYMAALTVDVGWVIQAETEEELPECMLGAIRMHHPDPLQAPRV